MARRRLVVGVAVTVLLVLGLAALLLMRGDSDGGRLSSSTPEPPTTVAAVATTLPAPTVLTTLPVATTTTTPRPPGTASTAPPPTSAPTTRPAAQQLTTTAGAHGPMQAALTQARQRWLAARPSQGYVWSYQMACRCSPRKVEVAVDGAGRVTSVRELDGAPSAQPAEVGLTVDAALAEVQAAVDADAAQIDARFDPVLGLPSSYFVDRSTSLADEERGLSLLSFTPRS